MKRFINILRLFVIKNLKYMKVLKDENIKNGGVLNLSTVLLFLFIELLSFFTPIGNTDFLEMCSPEG